MSKRRNNASGDGIIDGGISSKRFKGLQFDSLDFSMFKTKRAVENKYYKESDFFSTWFQLKTRSYKSIACNDEAGDYPDDGESNVQKIIVEFKKEIFFEKVIEEYIDFVMDRAVCESSALNNLSGTPKTIIDAPCKFSSKIEEMRCAHEFPETKQEKDRCLKCQSTWADVKIENLQLRECLFYTKDYTNLKEYKMISDAVGRDIDTQFMRKITQDELGVLTNHLKHLRDIQCGDDTSKNPLYEFLQDEKCAHYIMVNYRTQLDYVINVIKYLFHITKPEKVNVAVEPKYVYQLMLKQIKSYADKYNKTCLSRLISKCHPKECEALLNVLKLNRPMNTTNTDELTMSDKIWFNFMCGTNFVRSDDSFKEYTQTYQVKLDNLYTIKRTLRSIGMFPLKLRNTLSLMMDKRSMNSIRVCVRNKKYLLSINGSYFRDLQKPYDVTFNEISDPNMEKMPMRLNRYGPRTNKMNNLLIPNSETLQLYNVSRSSKMMHVQNMVGVKYRKNTVCYTQTSSI